MILFSFSFRNFLTHLLKLSYADFKFESRPFLRIISLLNHADKVVYAYNVVVYMFKIIDFLFLFFKFCLLYKIFLGIIIDPFDFDHEAKMCKKIISLIKLLN